MKLSLHNHTGSMENLSLDDRFDAIERRIRTLTTLLQDLQPKSTPEEVDSSCTTPGLLDHLVSLFQCDDVERDGFPTDRMAMTGVETSYGLRILAVTENTSLECDKVQVTRISRSDRTFDDLVFGKIGSSTDDYVTDIWTALAGFEEDPSDLCQRFHALTQFIVARKLWRMSSLLKEINSPCNLELSRILLDWEPQPYDLQDSRWIVVPPWFISIDHHKWHSWDLMEQRKASGPAGDEAQWKLSISTAKGWIGLLASILDTLVSEVHRHEAILESNSKDTSALEGIATWIYLLSSYLHWENVLETLLVNTSLSTHMFEKADLAHSDFAPRSGAYVLRHLRKIAAWHNALRNLCFNEEYSSIRKPSQSHAICLIQIPANPEVVSRQCSTREDFTSHFITKCTPSAETLKILEEVLDESYTADFYGSIHAEAALMGLITHYSPSSAATSNTYGVQFKQQTREMLEEFIRPLPAQKVIVLNDDASLCSCCRWLGTFLNNGFQLPLDEGGKSILMSAWTPPVGVDIALLEGFEAKLLDELDFRLRVIKLSKSHEDQPDTTSDGGDVGTMSDYSSPEDRDFEVSD